MESTTRTPSCSQDKTSSRIQPNGFHEPSDILLEPGNTARAEPVITALHRWSIPVLRIALGLVFFWFGALKVLGMSPITPMLRATYPLLALPNVTALLGVWELLIGIGLVFKVALRHTFWLMSLHLSGTFLAFFLAPSVFFLHGNPLVLTVNGEFVIKNLVLLTAGLVIVGNQTSPLSQRAGPVRMRLTERVKTARLRRGSRKSKIGLGQN